jgi:pyruvate-formate lyase-activating enzyme
MLYKFSDFLNESKARLLFTNDCNRYCKGCCNRNWKGEPPRLVSVEDAKGYDEIFITGGEPMLYPEQLKELILNLKENNNISKIFLYTALPYPKEKFLEILDLIDGCTVTLHNFEDRRKFIENEYDIMEFPDKAMKLNVFPRGNFKVSKSWNFRPKIWIKDAPLPEGEDFIRLN